MLQGALRRQPRSQTLPGLEQVRSRRLDALCEAIGDERETMNHARTEEKSLKASALEVMQREKLTVYRHAKVELARIPGVEKLRVRMTKEEGHVEVDTGHESSGADGPHPSEADAPF